MNSKEGQISVFYGAQIENAAEVACLSKLKRDLASQGIDAVLLANLTVGPSRRQIDLIVATNTTAVAVEIKGYVHSVQGKVNGPWKLELGNGKVKPLGRHNPYEQALTNRYAVTDGLGALLGISSETAKNVVAGMLCLYPKPMVGSRIPVSDFKLTIGGYEDLLTLLKIARREALPLEDWRRFARSLDLHDGSLAPPTEAEATVTHYLAAYDDLARVAAGPYIDPRFEKADTTGALAERIIAGAQVQIIGNSGSGKTELMKAVARSTAHAGCLPVLLRAGDFERQLAPLLQTAIARSSSVSPPKLFKAAADSGAEIILYVDGLNECPPKHRNELIEALQAARINYGARLIVTTQEQISLPKVLSGEVIRLVQPDRTQSQLLVAAHLGRKLTDNERDSVEVVATAHDAALLASVLETPSNIDGRFALYHSFVRTCLDVAYAEEMKNTLSTLATTMRTSFVSSLPVPSALRILNRNKPMTMEIACNSGLARIQDNRLAFRHDLIADFLAADGILHLASNAEELQALARQPINAELREFLLGGCGTISEIEALIGQKPDVRLLRAALSGRAGNKARNYVISRLRDLISLLKRNYSKVSLTLPEGVTRARDLLSLVPSLPDGIVSSEIDMAYMSIIPFALRDGLFTDLLDRFASVDSRLLSEAQRLRDAHPDLNILWQAAAYGTIYGMHHHQAGGRELQNLLQSIQNQWFSDSDRVPTLHLEGYWDRFETLSPGQIFLCVAASRSGHSNPLPFRFPALLQHIWSLGIYHLELIICDIIRFRGGELPDDQRQVVSELLHDRMSNDNVFMNSIIIDALEGVDGIEIALTVEDAVNEYEAMLAIPDSEEACSLAVGAITSTYDHPFRNVYWEAFYEALPIEKRQALLLRGLRDKRLDPWPIDDILRSLLREPTTDAAPELQKLAQIPILDSHSPQLALNVYANSIALLAKLAIPLASPNPPPDNPVHRAWYRAAVLIHALNADPKDSSRVTTSEVDEFRACGAAEAFDVIQRLVRERQNMLRPSNVDFESMWPDLVLELCRAALSSGYTPVSIFERTYFDRTLADDHFDLALSLMAKVGRATDISLVRAWLKHPKHGERALEAARSLERRSQ